MKALVLGASGQIGRALVSELARKKLRVVEADHLCPRSGSFSLDIGDAAGVQRCLDAVAPDWVFIAANTPGGVDRCEESPEEASALHLAGTRNVLEAAAGCRAKILYYSTDYVFDGKAGPYSEDSAPCPVNAYGRLKLAAEEAVRSYPHGHLIVRTTAVFSWAPGTKNFAMQLFENLRVGRSMRVPDDQCCDPTLAEDLAEASVALVLSGLQGTFNAVGGTRMTRAELAVSLAKALSLDAGLIVPTPTRELGQKAARPLQAGLTTDKLRKALGRKPWDIERSLKVFLEARRAATDAPAAACGEALKADILARARRYHSVAHVPPPFEPRHSRIHYAGRVFGEREVAAAVGSALDFWLTLGPQGDAFEAKMRRFFGAQDFVFVNSGSCANLAAVMALMSDRSPRPLRPGDEVITPAVTFPTTVTPLVHSGLVPVLVDCEVDTLNIDPRLIEGAVTPKTRAIVVPHTLGNPCDMDVICDLARRRGLLLLEDACDALGSTFGGKLVGTFGCLGTLSFYPAHHITTGEGGGVIVNSEELAPIVRSVRDWGRDCWCPAGRSASCGRRFEGKHGDLPAGYDHKYVYSSLGYNLKPTDIQAAIGVAQTDRIVDFSARRRRNFEVLYSGLERYQDRLILPRRDPRSDPSWFAFPVTVREGTDRRDLVACLEEAGVETRLVFAGNIVRQPAYRGLPMRPHGSLEQSDRVMRDSFFIGLYPGLTEEMLAFMLKTFEGFFARRGKASHA